MFIVEESGVKCLHAVEHGVVCIAFGSSHVFLVTEELVSVEHRLVHATMLATQESLQVGVAHLGNHVHTPVCQLTEQFLCCFVLTIYICIAQTGKNLMLTIERNPSPVSSDCLGAAFIELLP